MRRSDGRTQFAMLCAEAWLLVPLFAMALRLAPGRVMRRMRHTTAANLRPSCGPTAVAMAINEAATLLPGRLTTCLPRSCAAHVMLARRGVTSHLRIGVVRTPDGGVHAHAWLEAEGVDIGLDPSSPSFVMLPVSPTS
jgi:hypothetical protein